MHDIPAVESFILMAVLYKDANGKCYDTKHYPLVNNPDKITGEEFKNILKQEFDNVTETPEFYQNWLDKARQAPLDESNPTMFMCEEPWGDGTTEQWEIEYYRDPQ